MQPAALAGRSRIAHSTLPLSSPHPSHRCFLRRRPSTPRTLALPSRWQATQQAGGNGFHASIRCNVASSGSSLNIAEEGGEEEEEEVPSPSDLAAKIRPFRPFFLMLYLGLSIFAMIAGYAMHPTLLNLTATFWGIKPSVDDFESSFFGLLSIIYSVFAGQTFLFLFERQINMVQELYGEVFALELLVQQTFLVCNCPELKGSLANAVRQYMREEVYTPEDMASPFSKTSSYMAILHILAQMKGQGVVVTSLVDSCKQLADAQSRRSAMAAQILPQVHWVFMHGMELIFVFTFLVFDASELDMSNGNLDNVPEERRLFFGALFGLLALTTQVLKDLDDPLSGLYAFRAALDERTEYLESLLVDLETKSANYVPEAVETLELLGLIDSHRNDATDSIGHGACNVLVVPKTGGRRRRGRVTGKGFKWECEDSK